MIGSIVNWLLGSSEVKGTPSVQVNPASIGTLDYSKGFTTELSNPINAFSDKIYTVAPIGYSVPNPTNVSFNTPKPQTVVSGVKEVKESNAIRGVNCK